MISSCWEVHVTVSQSRDVPEVFLILGDVLKDNSTSVENYPMSIQAVDSKHLRAQSVGGARTWAYLVGGDMQAALDDLKIVATVSVVKKEL